MKKKNLVIAFLLTLSLCFIFFACDGLPETEDPEEPAEPTYTPADTAAMNILRDKIGYKGDFFNPKADYDSYAVDSTTDPTYLVIVWKSGNKDKYDDYVKAWGNKVQQSVSVARPIVVGEGMSDLLILGTGLTTKIALVKEDCEESSDTKKQLKANDIVFIIYKD